MSGSRAAIAFADSKEGSIALLEHTAGLIAVGQPVRYSNSKPMSLSLSKLGQSSILLAYYTNNPWRALVLKGDIVDDVRHSMSNRFDVNSRNRLKAMHLLVLGL